MNKHMGAVMGAYDDGVTEERQRILGIIDEIGGEFEHLPTWHYDGRTLQELRRRIEGK